MPEDHAPARRLTGWGRTRPAHTTVARPRTVDAARRYLAMHQTTIARGLGRSYGDAAQLEGSMVISTTRLRAGDVETGISPTGVVEVSAGTSIGELIDIWVPDGWFVPVTPGTRQVTVGGAIAADIHGKNHHVDGSFGRHVRSLRLVTATGEVVDASPEVEPHLFWATIGGMGLTGIVISAEIQLQPIESSRVRVLTQRTETLRDLMEVMAETDADHTFSVAWVDLLDRGRSVLTQGRFATAIEHDELTSPRSPSVRLPFNRSPRVLHRSSMRAMNEFWFRKAPAEPTTTYESITGFFHPLDAVTNWHLAYGRAGFVQWQFVVPFAASPVVHSIVDQLAAARAPTWFSVLKRFGAQGDGLLSFPTSGWTFAIDLPAADPSIWALLDRLDRQVLEAGGRIYLAKDARLDPALLAPMYPRLDEWRTVRDLWDPNRRFASDLSRRLHL